jgi:hypothetical protein
MNLIIDGVLTGEAAVALEPTEAKVDVADDKELVKMLLFGCCLDCFVCLILLAEPGKTD